MATYRKFKILAAKGSARVYTNNVDLMIDIAKDQQSEITNQPETV